jgi:hypothetical protein
MAGGPERSMSEIMADDSLHPNVRVELADLGWWSQRLQLDPLSVLREVALDTIKGVTTILNKLPRHLNEDEIAELSKHYLDLSSTLHQKFPDIYPSEEEYGQRNF